MGAIVPQVITEDRAGGGQIIDGGLRFDSGKSQYLKKTFSSDGNRTNWTYSCWIKKSNVSSGELRALVGSTSSNGQAYHMMGIEDDHTTFVYQRNVGNAEAYKYSSALFRDPSAWYHLVYSINVSTSSILLYVNGTQITSFSSSTFSGSFTQSTWNSGSLEHQIGAYLQAPRYASMQLAQVYFIDGQTLDPSYFGYTNPLTNTWRPKKYTGTYGTNGFWLPMDGNTPIGKDMSGNNNDWTPVNFGGSNTLEKATGALPILNTDGGGKVARVGVRTDSNASSLVLALPLVGIKSDFSNAINSGTSNKAITANGNAAASSAQSNFYSGSFVFDGTGDYLTVASTSDLTFGTGDFTLEYWINTTDTSFNFMHPESATGSGYWGHIIQSSSFKWNDAYATTNLWEVNGAPILDGRWHHCAICRASGVTKVFFDGVSQSTTSGTFTDSTNYNGTTAWEIGGSGNLSDFSGYIQDLRIYKGVAKYTQNFIPASTDPDILPDTPSGVAYSSNVALVPSTDGAVTFDGSGDYLQLAYSSDLDFTGEFTLEGFVYPNASTGDHSVFGNFLANATGNWGLAFDYSTYGVSTVFYYQGNTSISNSGYVPIPRAWNHYAVTRDASNVIRVFLNGQLLPTTATYSGTLGVNAQSSFIGWRAGLNPINGFISNVHWVKGTCLYTSNFTPPTAPITSVGNTKLLCCKSQTSATAADVTPGTITANGNAVASNFNPFTVNINTQRGQESGYCTLNPTIGATQLGGSTAPTYADGNSRVSFNGAAPAGGTIGVSSGKWYFEVLVNSAASTNNSTGFGIRNGLNAGAYNDFTGYFRGVRHNNSGNLTYSTSGDTGTSAGAIMAAGEVYGLTYDVDNNYFALYKNGVILVSSSSSSLSGGTWFPYAFGDSASGSHTFNFGQKPFKFPPPAGFQPLALANTPRPTIVRPDQYVGVTTYTGNGGTQNINTGFKPDFVWVKNRGASGNNFLADSVRGITKALISDVTDSEYTNANYITSFNSNGFTVGSDSGYNANANTYVSWAWKAGGNSNTYNINDVGYATASAAGLSAGTIIPSGASVNTKSGFSIIAYTGTGTSPVSINHGLNSSPTFLIFKDRDSAVNWQVWTTSVNSNGTLIEGLNTAAAGTTPWTYISTTSSLIQFNSGNTAQTSNGKRFICYAWHDVPGFSRFGSFSGNNSTDGVYVSLGFRPKFLIVKCIQDIAGDVEHWIIRDSTRSTYNPANANLYANLGNAEDDASGFSGSLDLLSNGFKMRGTYGGINASATYIYAAWAEAPTFNLYGGQANAR